MPGLTTSWLTAEGHIRVTRGFAIRLRGCDKDTREVLRDFLIGEILVENVNKPKMEA